MADIATIWDPASGTGDWSVSLTTGDLMGDQDLYSAVLISLFSDAEAAPDDEITDGSGDPRGWWGGPIGSKLWLYMRSKSTPLIPAQVQGTILDALQWLIDDGVAAAVDVTAEWTRPNLLGARVEISRTNGTTVAMNFARVWEGI